MTTLAAPRAAAPTATAEDVLASHFSLVSVPGAMDWIETAGAEGWRSPHPDPALSILRWTTRDPATAAAAVDGALGWFGARRRGFDWMTGPGCAEGGLLPLLAERGFDTTASRIAAMARDLREEPAATLPRGVHMRKGDDPADSRIWQVMARGFDIPDEVAAIFHRAYLTPSARQRTEVYAASLDDSDEPVGVGYLSYIGAGRAVLLRVSCTMEGSRGRGVYRALVLRRLVEAARQGRTLAYVHAYSDGSQRCLAGLGFARLGALQLHRWRP